ncbi:hypothetical protein KPN8_56 [Klebsiella phage KPN8]|nr:hypothetical protein KPN8_56 [Klebsiella phage KPN8]
MKKFRAVISASQSKEKLEHNEDTCLVDLGGVSDQLFSERSLEASLEALIEKGEVGEIITDPVYFDNEECLNKPTISFETLFAFFTGGWQYERKEGFYHISAKIRFLKEYESHSELEFIPRVVCDTTGRPKIVAFDLKPGESKIDPSIISECKNNSAGYAFGRTEVKSDYSVIFILGYFCKKRWSRDELINAMRYLCDKKSVGEFGRPPTGRSKERWRKIDLALSLGSIKEFHIEDYSDDAFVIKAKIDFNFPVGKVPCFIRRTQFVFAPRVSVSSDFYKYNRTLICFDLVQV